MTGSTTALLLGRVLFRARDTLGRSPEQVGAVVGVSSRTIRRLEGGSGGKPRRVTVDSLAAFYGLSAEFLGELLSWWDDSEGRLVERLRETATRALGDELAGALADDSEELAMRLARSAIRRAGRGAPGNSDDALSSFTPRERDEGRALLTDFLALDTRRRRLVRELVADLRRAQQAVRRNVASSDADLPID